MIRVCDAIMGSGKSSAAITYMNEHQDEHFIYITPYLDEATRIKECCPGLKFVEPSKGIAECGFTKTGHTLKLLEEGRNITTTHQAFRFYTQDTLTKILEKEYTLIIDEGVSVLENFEFNSGDLEVFIRGGYMRDVGGKYELIDDSYSGTAFSSMFRLLKSRELIRSGCEDQDTLFYWALPPSLIESFKDVYILTYLFEGQDIHHFLEMYELPYEYIGVSKGRDGTFRFSSEIFDVPEYTKTLGNHIHILDDAKLNAIGDDYYALSMNWFSKDGNADKVKRNVYNYFRNIIGDEASDSRMWATYDSFRGAIRGKGYTNKFVIFNEKATNKYRDRTVLVYAVNLFMNAGQKHFYQKKGVDADDDMYALSNMVQWIWRSAIRDGKDIWIYIPSRRMRDLLINWISEVELSGLNKNIEEMEVVSR